MSRLSLPPLRDLSAAWPGVPSALPVDLLWQSLLKKNDIVHRPLVDVVTVLRMTLWRGVVQAGALQRSSP